MCLRERERERERVCVSQRCNSHCELIVGCPGAYCLSGGGSIEVSASLEDTGDSASSPIPPGTDLETTATSEILGLPLLTSVIVFGSVGAVIVVCALSFCICCIVRRQRRSIEAAALGSAGHNTYQGTTRRQEAHAPPSFYPPQPNYQNGTSYDRVKPLDPDFADEDDYSPPAVPAYSRQVPSDGAYDSYYGGARELPETGSASGNTHQQFGSRQVRAAW